MLLSQLLPILRTLAPEHLAEPWDHVGLQLGESSWPVRRALLCIDLTEPVLEEAIAQRADLILSYHPPIFDPLSALTDRIANQRIILHAARRGIAIYSPHTALDSAAGGINDWLCESVLPGVVAAVSAEASKGALAHGGDIRPIRPASPRQDQRPYKLVTFVPPAHYDKLLQALSQAGAGQIGDYSECSFSVEGQGTFRGGDTTHPTIGQRGRLERVTERRMETIIPADRLAEVVAALMKSHPYEEPAFDLIRLELPPALGGEGVGQGRVVTLEKPISLRTLTQRLKKQLGVKTLQVAAPPGKSQLRRIAFCAGSGGSLLKDAGPIDAFVTGEMRHHDILAAVARHCCVLLAGHTQTERPYLPIYRQRLVSKTRRAIHWLLSRTDRAPGSLM